MWGKMEDDTMNGKEKAIRQLLTFLKSDERFAILTGTHQHKKHKLALQVIDYYYRRKNILFRGSNLTTISEYLEEFKPIKTGRPYQLQNNTMYIDTVDRKAWGKNGQPTEIAIVYPLKVIEKKEVREQVVNNLIDSLKIEKVLFISCQDTLDLSWAKDINTKIVYDSLEDDPEYHQRVLDFMSKNGFNRL